MKKNQSGLILAAEILIVILFHVYKIRQNENILPENALVRMSKGAVNISKSALNFKSNPEYFFVNVLK
jgi:hypothetical protein